MEILEASFKASIVNVLRCIWYMMSYIQLIQCNHLDFCYYDGLPINNWFSWVLHGDCLRIYSVYIFEILINCVQYFVCSKLNLYVMF